MADSEVITPSREKPQKRKAWDVLTDTEDAALSKKLFGVTAEVYSSDEEQESGDDSEVVQTTSSVTSKAVWEDEDDLEEEDVELPKKKSAVFLKKSTDGGEKISKREYQERVKALFAQTRNAGKLPTWASGKRKVVALDADESDDDVNDAIKIMTRTTGKYTVKSEFLPKSVIQTTLLPEITIGHHDGKQISAIRFHKSKNVVITGDHGGNIKLFEVDSDAKKEHFLQKIRFKRFPIQSMDFAGPDSVICGALTSEHLMRYNLVNGSVTELQLPAAVRRQSARNFAISSDGKIIAIAAYSNQIHLISSASMEHIQTASVQSPVASLSFLPGSNSELWILCENGQVNYWQSNSCSLHSFIDEGAIHGTKITFTQDGYYMACGSNSGIVNIYETTEAKLSTQPKPVAVHKSLVNNCDSLAFNHDGQILAAGSSTKPNQLKLFHMRSKTVFANFPQQFEKIPCATSVEFSPHSAYLSVGCQNGRLRLYRISHFDDY